MPIEETESQNALYRVMVVDDDETMRYVISRVLRRCECDVLTAQSAEEAIEYLADNPLDIIFSDLRMPQSMGGVALLEKVVERFPETEVVLMSSDLENQVRQDLLAKGALEAFRKPFFEQECCDLLMRYSDPLRKVA